MATAAPRIGKHSRATFVRASVEFNDVTEHVVDAIMPYFPQNCKVIGGYVSVSKQYWKVNFHWEYLLRHLDKAADMDLSPQHLKCVKAIRSVLIANRPQPEKGYMASKSMGKPQDMSSLESVVRRWKALRQCKKDFKSVITAARLLNGMTSKQRKVWLLAVAPVAKPGKSKHSTGYAVDLYGSNSEIMKISKGLGASLVFPEGSHVHVEFKDGVAGKPIPRGAGVAPADADSDHYAEDMCLLTPAELAELKQSTRNASATGDFGEDVSFLDTLRGLFDDSLGEDWW